jgi:hypothetical protein
MTHKTLKEQGYKLSRWNAYRRPRRSRNRHTCAYALYDSNDKFLGSILPVKDKYGRWGAHPRLKSDAHSARVQSISEHATVPDAAAAIIRFNQAEPRPRRPAVTCPRCGATSRVLYTMGGVQTRLCKSGHQFEYDKWMADRLIWAPGAIGSLTR